MNKLNQDSGTRYLSFSLGTEDYAIPLLCVKEVIAIPEITPMPFSPPHFLGIMNLRGQVISIVDLRKKLGIKAQNTSESAVIICDLGQVCLGIVVDSINSVLTPQESELSEKPVFENMAATDYVTHVYRKDKKLILLLNIAKALNVEDYQAISKSAPSLEKKAA
jgi:purine-binding chemotaxis protein CheW